MGDRKEEREKKRSERQEKIRARRKETSTNVKPVESQPPQEMVNAGDVDFLDAKEAANGAVSGWDYRKRKRREGKNLSEIIETDKITAEAIKQKTEGVKAAKGYYRETGQLGKLPELDRKEVELEVMEVDTDTLKEQRRQEKQKTKIMREELEQVGLAREIDSVGGAAQAPVMSEGEKHKQATEVQKHRLEHELEVTYFW